MKKIFFFTLFAAIAAGVCSLSLASESQKTNQNAGNSQKKVRNLLIVQVSDPQIGFSKYDGDGFAESQPFEETILQLNKLKPDIVVVTGDMVNTYDNPKQIAEFNRIMNLLNNKIKRYYIPGNHDWGKEAPLNKTLYRSQFGADHFVTVQNDVLLYGINTCNIKEAPDSIEQKEFDILSKKLNQQPVNQPKILFIHHPIVIRDLNEAESYSNFPAALRDRYLELLDRCGVTLVLPGHLHDNAEISYKNVTLITTSSISKALGKAPSGIRIIEAGPDHIAQRFYPLDQIPASRKNIQFEQVIPTRQ